MEKVLDIWLRASVQAHGFIDAAFWHAQRDSMRTLYLPVATTYVFERDGAVAGFYSLHGDVLAALFVDPDSQAGGIGSLLLADAKTRRSVLELSVYSANQAARRFYARHGFVAFGERPDEHTGHPETLMRWQA
ncbi:GNAT family N-acetyltransferase [Massilia consociata]|uniref:GNAT family N-acetyltransferase n=1 Tax=Massilia consociata TaxID=760117 RepID=A0ABV6FCL9_9BURK